MGLQNNNERGNYIKIINGKIAIRVPEGTEGAVKRFIEETGKTVHEKLYDSFTGKLVGIKTQDGTYGKQWFFSFMDSAETYILAMPYDAVNALNFLAMLPNVDVSREFKLSTALTTNGKGNEVTSIFINQDGNVIKHAHTKSNPNGMPAWKEVTINGKTMFDKSETLAFFEEMLARDILPKLPKVEEAVQATQEGGDQKATSLDDFADTPDGEDEPF